MIKLAVAVGGLSSGRSTICTYVGSTMNIYLCQVKMLDISRFSSTFLKFLKHKCRHFAIFVDFFEISET
jgi:hypothetical protein